MTHENAQPENQTSFPTVGQWIVTGLPRGWMYLVDFGIREIAADSATVVASVGLGQDELANGTGLAAYLAKQLDMINGHLDRPAIAGPQATGFPGADEASLLFVRHTAPNGMLMLHAQTYVRRGVWVGIVTLSTPEAKLAAVRPDYEAFLRGLRIAPPATAVPVA